MSFTASFGTVSKKHNSTARGSHSFEVPVTLKEDCSVLNPSLLVNLTASQIFGNGTLNHCYIAQFNRYYFVDNWTWERGLWRADCSVDVLASWKDVIGSSSQYILRSSAASDGAILDTMYPTKNQITTESLSVFSPFLVSDGYYVLGIISKVGSPYGAITYYAFTAGQFSTLCSVLFGTGYLTQAEITEITQDISLETWKSLYNPLQYIASCVYIPCDISDSISPSDVSVGYWSMGVSASRLTTTQPARVSCTLAWVGTHPNASRGSYVYCAPYTDTDLDIMPFGHVALPSDIVHANGGVTCDIDVDIITGRGVCYIGGRIKPYLTLQAQVGVPIQLAQMSRDYLGTASTAVSSIASTIGAALTGDIAGAVASGASAIDSTVRAQVPRLNTLGSGGSFSDLVSMPTLTIRYKALVDDDNSRLGRPLCKARRVADIPGYIMCCRAAVNTDGTDEENKKIADLMNGGFYYE